MSAAVLQGCGGGHEVTIRDGSTDSVGGRVIKGPVARGLVSAYRLDAQMQRGELLGTSPTDDSGAFSIPLRAYSGHILLVANGGTYAEEAVGSATRLDGFELTAVLPEYQALSTVSGILVTPVSHWAAGLAAHYVKDEGQSFASANNEAWQHLNGHFGNFDWRQIAPSDLTDGGVAYDIAGKGGLLLSALSMQARSIAESAGQTAGNAVTAISLTKALYDDLSFDGYFDGQGSGGSIVLPSGGQLTQQGPTAYQLDGESVRLTYALAVEHFLQSTRNGSRITPADASELRQALSTDSNPRIFRTPGQPYTSEPPTVEIVDSVPQVLPESPLVFRVRASNPRATGVRMVYARNGPSELTRGTRSGGLWTFSIPLSPGRNALSVWAEDNAIPPNSGERFGAPYRRSLELSFTKVPPIVEWVTIPPQYTRSRPLALRVRAINPTRYGVSRVLAQVGTAPPVVGTLNSGLWNFSLPLVDGHNAISVWAEDNDSPPASGAGLQPPYRQSADVLYSNRTITVAVEPVPSYIDEQPMYVRESSPGVPYVPVQYMFPSMQRAVLTNRSSVWKTSTRLSWGPTVPSGVELEGANVSNTPFVQYRIGYNPQLDAPIAEATYSIATARCEGCTPLSIVRGTLTSGGRTAPGLLFFDLPLASENIPALNQLTSSAGSLTVGVNFIDAAGNVGAHSSMNLTFHILGPPVSIAEDTSYAQTTDPRSVYMHRISNGTYASLWEGSSFGSEEVVRFIRYVVRNPHSTPVQLLIQTPGMFGMTDRWNDETWQWLQWYWRGSLRVMPAYLWNIGPGSSCVPELHPNFPCRYHPTEYPVMWNPYGSTFDCYLLPAPRPATGRDAYYSTGSTEIVSSGWRVDDESQAAITVAGRRVIPPANWTTPGGLAIYVGRRFVQGYRPDLIYTVIENPTGLPRYHNWSRDFWIKEGDDVRCCDSSPARCQLYRGYRYAAVLVAATERLDGSATFTAFAPSSHPSDPLGEGRGIANHRVQKEVGH